MLHTVLLVTVWADKGSMPGLSTAVNVPGEPPAQRHATS